MLKTFISFIYFFLNESVYILQFSVFLFSRWVLLNQRRAPQRPVSARGARKAVRADRVWLCDPKQGRGITQVICHGIPDRRELQDGDIVNVDVSVYLNGFHGDLNETYVVGEVDPVSKNLIRATSQVLFPPPPSSFPPSSYNALSLHPSSFDSNFDPCGLASLPCHALNPALSLHLTFLAALALAGGSFLASPSEFKRPLGTPGGSGRVRIPAAMSIHEGRLEKSLRQ